MARKKTHKKSSHKRRRRIGATGSNVKAALMQSATGVLGAVAASYITTAVKGALEKNDSTKEYAGYIGAAAPIVAAILLPKLIKQRSPFIDGAKNGMLIGGGLSLVKELNILPGVGAINYNSDYATPFVAGLNDVPNSDYRSQQMQQVAGIPAFSYGMAEDCNC